MLRGKLLSTCAAMALAISLPLSVSPQVLVPRADDTEVNGVMLNGVMLNGVMLNGVMLNGVMLNGVMLNGVMLNGVMLNGVSNHRAEMANSVAQPVRVEGGQLVLRSEIVQ